MADELEFTYDSDEQQEAPQEEPKEEVIEKKLKEPLFQRIKSSVKKIYHFLWEEESVTSYLVFIILSYLILRFVFFPGVLFVTGYSDIAAVISGSMTHKNIHIDHNFYDWAEFNGFSQEDIENWDYSKGINIGDAVLVKKVNESSIEVGDVILFYYSNKQIVHRVVLIDKVNGEFFYTTKGDANAASSSIEKNLPYSQVKGKVVGVVPFLGIPKYLATLVIPFI